MKRPDVESQPEATEELSRVYQWNGEDLLPFSAGRHTALQRLRVIGGSEYEAAAALIRICQLPSDEVARLRGEACSEFHVELAEWMDQQGIGFGAARKEKTAQLVNLYRDILNDLYEVQRIGPESDGGPPAPGNA
jgi:hypothetical protein